MGWFRREGRRQAGQKGYGVPDVTFRPTPVLGPVIAATAALDLVDPPQVPVAPIEAAAPPAPPPRLPDDRTTEQIGDKVADVLWSYYAQQGSSGTPLAPVAEPALVYDDSYGGAYDALVAPELFVPEPSATDDRREVHDDLWQPVYQPPEMRVTPPAPVAPVAAQVTPVVVAAVLAPARPRFRVFERPRAGKPVAVTAPISVALVPSAAAHVASGAVALLAAPLLVQLGFLDGSTHDLPGDHPAAKALRAAADALTLRD